VTGLGVVGAGTMGAGIAQIGALAGMDTVVHDPDLSALEAGMERVRARLTSGAERGRWSAIDASDAASRLRAADSIEALAGCDVVIEAGPEDLAVKRAIFASLAGACAPEALLATNTSSIPVTAIAAHVPNPERVVGLHFFNPVPLMKLVEVVPATQTSPLVIEHAREVGEALGKRVIVAQDGPGFLVNRCGRPFYGEALRLLAEQVAGVEQIDRICRIGGRFRMGPFELMDLVGIDVGLAVARSIADRSFGEPRWRPSPLQALMVESGRLGRKSGHGWYVYGDGEYRADDPAPPDPADAGGRPLSVIGTGPVAERLRALAQTAGFAVSTEDMAHAGPVILAEGQLRRPANDAECPILSCASRSLASWGAPRSVGFSVLPTTQEVRLVELTRGSACSEQDAGQAKELFNAMGLHVEWVGDAPGLVLGRIVAQIVNEACFAVGEGIATGEDVDAGARLGLNYPRGPLAWGAELGWDVVAGWIEGLWRERREERYRPAPWLLRAAMGGGDAGSARPR
jgi:3-hydroxybutyryl-CoA dehydrogenase